jgi:serine O-acetyltransferase
MAKDFYTRLVYLRNKPLVGRLAYYLLKILGVEIPRQVTIGKDFELAHGGFGVVIHSKTKIGQGVKIYPGVGLGRADIYLPASESSFEGIELADEVILAPGAKVLCKEGQLKIGRGSVIGANAVLLESTGEYEIWAGVPARRVGLRPRGSMRQASDKTGPDGS